MFQLSIHTKPQQSIPLYETTILILQIKKEIFPSHRKAAGLHDQFNENKVKLIIASVISTKEIESVILQSISNSGAISILCTFNFLLLSSSIAHYKRLSLSVQWVGWIWIQKKWQKYVKTHSPILQQSTSLNKEHCQYKKMVISK